MKMTVVAATLTKGGGDGWGVGFHFCSERGRWLGVGEGVCVCGVVFKSN